jgi:hypothetical protein
MGKRGFLLSGIFMVFCIINGYSQNSLDDLNVVFKNDFEDNTLGHYTSEEWNADFWNPEWCNRQAALQITQDINDPVDPTKTMQIDYPALSTGPAEGGTNWFTIFQGQTELYMSYDIYLMPGFDYASGGKLFSYQAGLFTDNSVTGIDIATMGLMWNKSGNITFYFYYPDSKMEEWGETVGWGYANYPVDYFKPSKISVKYTSKTNAVLTSGTWHNITYRTVLNTVPSEGAGKFDGIMEGYLDGKLIIQMDSILFRNTNNLKIDHLRMCNFFGGDRGPVGDPNYHLWENDYYEWQKFDNMILYSYKDNITVPRGNVFSATNRTINYWRNFGKAIPEPDPIIDNPVGATTKIKINFVRDAELKGAADWNNLIERSNGTTYHLTNENQQLTDLNLVVKSDQIYGSVAGAFPGIYPDEVMKTGWRADNYTTKTLRIENLDPQKTYKFEVFGTNTQENSVTTYTIANIAKSLYIFNNKSNTVDWNIKPDKTYIDITWNGGQYYYGFLNSLIVSENNNNQIALDTEANTQTEQKDILNIYPNPSKGQVNIKISNPATTDEQISVLRVIDQSGRIIFNKEIDNSNSDGNEFIDLSDEAEGIYYFQLQTSGKSETQKLILRH